MDRGGYSVVRVRHTGRGAYMVINGVRSDRTATDADALFRGVSWPNRWAGSVARDSILDDNVLLRVMRIAPSPISNLCQA